MRTGEGRALTAASESRRRRPARRFGQDHPPARQKDHRKFVAAQPCVVCGRSPADPHHLRFARPRALGRKVSDEFTVPICRIHHDALHKRGDEAAWWRSVNIDPAPIALALWRRTRTDPFPDALPEAAASAENGDRC